MGEDGDWYARRLYFGGDKAYLDHCRRFRQGRLRASLYELLDDDSLFQLAFAVRIDQDQPWNQNPLPDGLEFSHLTTGC